MVDFIWAVLTHTGSHSHPNLQHVTNDSLQMDKEDDLY